MLQIKNLFISFYLQYVGNRYCTEAEFLDEIQTKVFKSFSPLYSQSPLHLYLGILFLQTYATSYNFYSSVTVLYTVKEKGGKPYPLPYGVRNLYRITINVPFLYVAGRNDFDWGKPISRAIGRGGP